MREDTSKKLVEVRLTKKDSIQLKKRKTRRATEAEAVEVAVEEEEEAPEVEEVAPEEAEAEVKKVKDLTVDIEEEVEEIRSTEAKEK